MDSTVKVRRFDGERSERCMLCFRYRLEESFRYARDNSFDAVATVMSVSPHKDAEMLNEAGRSLKRRYGVGFLEADFKKNDGYRKSVEISRANGFYRQDTAVAYIRVWKEKNTQYGTPPRKIFNFSSPLFVLITGTISATGIS